MPGKLSDITGQEENLYHNTEFQFNSQMVLKCFPLYSSKESTTPVKKISLADIIQMAKNPTIRPKKEAQAITPYLSKAKTLNAAQVAEYYAIMVDHDHDDLTAAGIRAIYDPYDIAYFIFTTTRHLLENFGNRRKVLIPLSCPVRQEEWVKISRGFALKIGADLSQARVQQFFYTPNKLTANAPYEFIDETHRPFLNPNNITHPFIKDALKAYEANEKAKEAIAAAAIPKPRLNNNTHGTTIEKVNQGQDIVEVLLNHGYVRKGKKYLSPNSESGMPGVTILPGNRCYSHHGVSDPLSNLNNAGHSLDPFDVFCILDYGGDVSRAVKELAAQVDPEGQKQRQIEYMQEKALLNLGSVTPNAIGDENNGYFNIMQYSMKGRSDEMKQKMLEDKFVLGQLAILGQSTIFYGKPNAGKTLLILWLIIQAIKSGEINGDDVFYINADDTYKGLVYKLTIAEKYGFHMMAPGHGQPGGPEFKSAHLPVYLAKMIAQNQAAGKIFILDTVKKNTDLMNKKVCSEFGENIRQFISHGGTVIMLAHVNKHRDEDKKIVYSGTTDLIDDADCAYTLDTIQDDPNGMRTVKFENIKNRGDVTLEAFYKYNYQSVTSYFDRLDSVTPIGNEERKKIEAQKKLDAIYNKNKNAIDAIKKCIDEGINTKTELIKEAASRSYESKNKIRKALDEHLGTDKLKNQFWFKKIGEKNAHTYHKNYGTADGK